MTLVLNEEQVMLRDAASGFLSEKANLSHLREMRDSDGDLPYSTDVWREMVEMGWAGIAIDEVYGGLGYGFKGLGILLEQTGRHLSASPLHSAISISATLIDKLGSEAQKSEMLSKVAGGSFLATLGLQESDIHKPAFISTRAEKTPGGFRLTGSKVMVMDLHACTHTIVIARTSGNSEDYSGLTAFMVSNEAEGISIERTPMVDSRNYGRIKLLNVEVQDSAVLGDVDTAWDGLSTTLDIANIGLAAELLGLSEEAFQRTVKYLQERKQFGSFIGSFQGLQHRAAEIFAELELCRSLVLKALHVIDQGSDELPLLASATKAKLCEVAQRATNEAIQMHGGIGMTDDYEIGFFIKRARVLQHIFGDYNYHLDRYALLSGF